MKTPLLALALLVLPLAGCIDTPQDLDAASLPEGAGTAAEVLAGPFEAAGTSSFTMVGGCPLVACVFYGAVDFGGFKLDAPADGLVLTAEWSAVNPAEDELIIELWKGDEVVSAQTGTSPLTFDLGALAAGGYDVGIWFPVPVGAYDVEVSWKVAGDYSLTTDE